MVIYFLDISISFCLRALSLSPCDFGFNCLRFILQFFNSQLIRPRVIAQFLAEYYKQYSTYAFLFYFIYYYYFNNYKKQYSTPVFLFIFLLLLLFYKFNHTFYYWIKTLTGSEFLLI